MKELFRKRNVRKIISIILTITIIFTSIGLENIKNEAKAATSYTTLYLVDDTPEHWIGNDSAVIEMVDNTYGHDRYIMTKETGNKWSVRVPVTTYNVTFNRLSPDKSTQWNSWSAGGRDSHSTYHAITHEHGYWDGTAVTDEGFHEGDKIYLDYYEFNDWKKSGAHFYVNFTGNSKQENNGLDININSTDPKKYSPIKLENEIEEDVYTYTVTKEDEGAKELRFWRGNADTLWNCSVTLTYSDYKAGNNCAKIQGWDDTGYVCPYVPRRHKTRIDNIELKVSGNKKINRKVEIDLDIQGETGLLIQDKTEITIEKESNGEGSTEYVLSDDSKTTWIHRELIFKEAGSYHITAAATDGTDTFTTDTYITIADDEAPLAGLKLNNDKENTYLRDSGGTAHITVTDTSVSETGDEITKRIYGLYYDADGNGEFEEEELISLTEGNETVADYDLQSVGKYMVKLHIQETYTDTIPELISDSDYLSADTEEIFEIANQAPESSMSLEKSRIADIIFTVGNADRDILGKYISAGEKVKEKLKGLGIEANVSTISTSALTAQDTFAWTEYDHYDYIEYGQKLPKHIIYDDKDIKMVGYFGTPIKDFLYIDDEDSSRKVFEFDLRRDYNNWHSMEGGGFLFNTKISEEEDYIQGYCILVTASGLQLVQINKVKLSSFRNGSYNNMYHTGKLLQTFPMQNLYDEHHIKIVTDKNILTVYDGEKLLIDEYVLPDDGVDAYGYGPIISHLGHGCEQRSYFTFKNIVMQTITGESLSDVVNNHKWTPGTNHYVINMSETSVPELSDNDRMSDVAAAMIQNDAMFFGIGNNITTDQYNTLLNTLEGKGENLELLYEDDENNEEESGKVTAEEAVDHIVSRIIADINGKDYTIGYTITTDEEAVYTGTYSDPDNDPEGQEEWKYIYDASVFGENSAGVQEIKRDIPITMFTDAGAYEISHRVSDNPTGGNPALDSYIKWSDTDDYKKLILSQHRPMAKVTATVTQSPSDSSRCMVNVIYESEDPDHPSDLRKGIRDEKFYYKEPGDTVWTEGRFPAEVSGGTTYLVKYMVTDIEGTVSRPAVAAIKTSEARVFIEPEDTNPPVIELTVSSNIVEAGKTFYIETSVTDDYGITDFSVDVNGENIGSTYGRYDFTAENAGEAVITVTATDIGKNTSTETKTVTIIDNSDVIPPDINIISPENGAISGKTDIVGSITDNRQLKSYTVTRTYTGTGGEDTELTKPEIIAGGTEEITDDIIATIDTDGLINGVYKIDITAEDMAGLISTVTLLITVEETVSDRIPPQAEIGDIVLVEAGNETDCSAVIEITGSITDETELGGYELVMYPSGNDKDRTTVSAGTKSVINELIGTVSTKNLESGTYILELKAWDTEGNTCVSGASFEYTKGVADNGEIERDEDITPPVIAGELKAAIKDGRLNLILSGTVDDENLKEYTVTTGRVYENEIILPVTIAHGTENIFDGTIAEYTYESFSEGDYAVCITAEDNAGNKRTATYTVSITKQGTINDGYNGGNTGETDNDLLNLVLSGTSANTGDVIKAYMTYPENATDVSLTADGADVTVYGRNADITSETAGEVEVILSAVIDGETKTVSKKARFFDKSDKVHPVAYFLSPEADSVVKTKTEITGTAMDETGMAYYTLEYRMEGTDEYRQIAYGTEPVMDSVLGELDTTTLENGSYLLRLTVVDNGGNRIRMERGINVEGNLKVGNMNLSFTDINANVSGIPLTVTRSYDSRNKSSGDFGTGWKLGMQSVRLTESSDITEGYKMVQTGEKLSTGYFMSQTKCHDITVTYGDGTSDRFELKLTPERQGLIPIYEVQITFVCVTDKNVKLKLNGDNHALVYGDQLLLEDDMLFDSRSYVLTKKDGTKLYLDSDYGLLKMEDTNGNTVSVSKNGFKHSDGNGVTFTRDGKGRVIKAEEKGSKGNVIASMTYAYDNRDNLIAVTDDADRTVMFTYDDDHNLIDIIDPSGMAVARNVYDDDGRLVATIDADGNRVEYEHDVDGRTETVRDKMGNVTVYTYDDNGNILQTVDALGNVTGSTYDENNNVLTRTDALGNEELYKYDKNNQVTEYTDKAGNVTIYEYNDLGEIVKQTDAKGAISEKSYDSKGNLLSETDKMGNTIEYMYDSKGNVISETGLDGNMVTYSYGNSNIPQKYKDFKDNETLYDYDSKDRLIQEKTIYSDGKSEHIKSYEYDVYGNLIKEYENGSIVILNEYNQNGQLVSKEDKYGNTISYEYDACGNKEKVIYDDGTYELFAYDSNGNVLKQVDRSGEKTEYQYDKLNRKIKALYSDGSSESYSYSARGDLLQYTNRLGLIVSYQYDANGNKIEESNPITGKVTYKYDEIGQLTETTDSMNATTRYEYDLNGNNIKVIYADGTEEQYIYDGNGNKTSCIDREGYRYNYSYDCNGNLIKVVDSAGHTTGYDYDVRDNKISETDANGNTTYFEYDVNGNIVSTTLPKGEKDKYVYDKDNKLIYSIDYNGVRTDYSYNNNGNIKRKESANKSFIEYEYYPDGKLRKINTESGSELYEWNNDGKIISKADVNGEKVEYTYDSMGNVLNIKSSCGDIHYQYDLLGRLIQVTDTDGNNTKYEYDNNGNMIKELLPNGLTTGYEYNSVSELTNLKTVNSANETVSSYSYILGDNGERLKVIENNGNTTEYKYDELYQLIGEKSVDEDGNISVSKYSYDKVGNRIAKEQNGIKTDYTYNENNQLVKEGGITYDYDNNGNLISKNDESGTITYKYNEHNQLVDISVNGLAKYSYEYDTAGNRISQKDIENDEKIYYTWDANRDIPQILYESEGSDTDKSIVCTYTFGDKLIGQSYSENKNYYLCDGQLSVRKLADSEGNITDMYDYDAFGNVINSSGDTENSFMYTGQQFDADTGLYYLRARYMNPSNGRFLSRDLYSGNEFEPQTLHKYAYVSNNPVNNYDPLGLWMQKVIQGILAHRFINVQYIIEHPKHTVNYDRKNGFIAGGGLRGFVDIIDYTTHEIYEIKPYKGKVDGVAQVESYLKIINGYIQSGEFFDGKKFRLGDSWPVGTRMSSWPLGGVISYWLEQNGLIEYYVQREDGEQYDNAYSWGMLKWKEFDVGTVTQVEVVMLLAACLPNIIRLAYQARMVSMAF